MLFDGPPRRLMVVYGLERSRMSVLRWLTPVTFMVGLIPLTRSSLAGVPPQNKVVAETSARTVVSYTPIEFRQASGTRPFVHVKMNGKPFDLMIHANLALYVMTTHANAAAIGIGNLKKASNVGIDKGGHVSELGLAHAKLKTLNVGSREVTNVPLEVFEVPIPHLEGMLGIQWIRQNRVIVDYNDYRIGFPSSEEASRAEDERLSRSGFIGHRMTWDPTTTTYKIDVVIDGKSAHLVVSTVSADTLDLNTSRAAGLTIGPKSGG